MTTTITRFTAKEQRDLLRIVFVLRNDKAVDVVRRYRWHPHIEGVQHDAGTS